MANPNPRKTYTRDDGVVMVDVSPNLYTEESIAERLGLSGKVLLDLQTGETTENAGRSSD